MTSVYKNIVLAVDLLPCCEPLIKKTIALARLHQAKLKLLHVITRDPIADHMFVDKPDYERSVTEAATKRFAELCHAVKGIEADQVIEIGNPKTIIPEVATRSNCDLIVVGSHGQHGIKALLGSTASAVTHAAQCDVLVLRCI